MKKYSKLIVLLLPLIIAGCRRGGGTTTSSSPTSDDPTTQATTGGQSTTASSGTSSSTEDTNTFTTSIAGVTREHLVTTSGSYFTSSFTSGVQIVNNKGTYIESSNFITFFNESCVDPLLWKIKGINVMANETGDGENKLKIGSKNEGQDGELTLLFNYQVTKIELQALPYYKHDTYHDTYNVDNTTSILIDNEKTSLACTAGAVPTPTAVTKSYSTPVNEITLSTPECDGDSGQRTFINSIKITYIA